MKTNIDPQLTDQSQQAKRLFVALELSNQKWLMCFSQGERFRKRSVAAGHWAGLIQEIQLAKEKFGLAPEVEVISCYEAGRDGFWLHRCLAKHGVANRVLDPASLQVDRRQKHKKTDRLDAEKLVRALMRRELWGERAACAVVQVPQPADEAAMRKHRERERLVKEITGHRCRLKSLLVLHGVKVRQVDRVEMSQLRDWQGQPLPEPKLAELEREQQRLQLVQTQLRSLEQEQQQGLKQPQGVLEQKAFKLHQLRGVGMQSSWVLAHEFGWRDFKNRKEVGSCAGLTGSPYDSGQSSREQGISKAGNRRVRTLMIELAWGWLRFQPQSALSVWFGQRYGSGNRRMRRIGIVALARKLLVGLWKYQERDLVPEGAVIQAR